MQVRVVLTICLPLSGDVHKEEKGHCDALFEGEGHFFLFSVILHDWALLYALFYLGY